MNESNQRTAVLLAGVPNTSMAIFHRTAFAAGDPVIWIAFDDGKKVAIVRDVELPRARKSIDVDRVFTYEDFAPPNGSLSGDRAVRAAQSAAECLRREGVERVRVDRSLSVLFVREIERAGTAVELDLSLGVDDRRRKTPREMDAMARAQRVAEGVIERTCQMIARATAGAGGVLQSGGQTLTSERLQSLIDGWLSAQGYEHKGAIVAGGPIAADCHHAGTGELRTGELVIVDVFPRDKATGYHGDCTRTVVHGDVPDEPKRMHETVAKAKRAGIAACRAGTTGDAAHAASVAVIQRAGYTLDAPPEADLAATAPTGFCSMPHGTGHGLGLELKELPLIDFGGPTLVVGDVVTIEPGLYAPGLGGVRIEDMIAITQSGSTNFNVLHDGLDWR